MHHSFQNFERISALMITKAKGLEVIKMDFIINLSTFDSKVFLTLKIMDFENVRFTIVVFIYVIEGRNA